MSMQTLTQTQRVLRLALERGDTGITAVDFLLPDVADGGKPITRLAARVKDLTDDGIRFIDGGTRQSCKVYILDRASLADATKPAESGPPAAPSPVSSSPDSDTACHAAAGGPESVDNAPALFDTEPLGLDFDRDICPPPRSAIYGEEAA